MLFHLQRLRERLWVKPLSVAVFSIAAALLTETVDSAAIVRFLPRIEQETVETLLEIMAASMLVIATFSVASMVSAYSSASNSATPRSFPLIVADDLSQNALSSFIGAFIFSIVALVALKNGYYEQAGLTVLFALTIAVFAFVILAFVRWVDGIARLGRLGNTIDKVEAATGRALARRNANPALGGKVLVQAPAACTAVYGEVIGYVQHIKMDVLQECAEALDADIAVNAVPGAFAAPGVPLAHVVAGEVDEVHARKLRNSFIVGGERTFEDDPRFGLIVLSEIAGRALSPAVNDPGTAIDIVGTFVRLLCTWANPAEANECPSRSV